VSEFRFRLQRVLDYRTSLVEAQEVELSRCSHELRRALDDLGAIQLEEEMHLAAMKHAVQGLLSLDRLLASWRYLSRLREREASAGEHVERCRQRVEDERRKLAERKKEEQVIAKLRERQRERAALLARRLETNQLDDLTGTRYSRG